MIDLPKMTDALRLTRAGDLAGATALIRSLLVPGKTSTAPVAAGGPVIDIVAERVVMASPGEPAPAARAARADALTAGFQARRFAGAAGTLDYKLYVPAGGADGMPLVVMLHGCTQSPDDFARGTGMNRLADELGFLVAYPGQTRTANAQRCWNWFKPGDQRRDQGEPAVIAGITREVVAATRGDPRRVYIAGLSAGGAAAAIMGAAYPDLYAALGIHSGLACGAARDLPSALAAMRSGGGGATLRAGARPVPVITFHGDRDSTVHEANSRDIVTAAAAASGVALETRSETGARAGGRAWTRAVSRDAGGRALIEQWTIHGAGHAWSGGDAAGSYTDPAGPDASREMLRFFLEHELGT